MYLIRTQWGWSLLASEDLSGDSLIVSCSDAHLAETLDHYTTWGAITVLPGYQEV
jgi:hypothetical protein